MCLFISLTPDTVLVIMCFKILGLFQEGSASWIIRSLHGCWQKAWFILYGYMGCLRIFTTWLASARMNSPRAKKAKPGCLLESVFGSHTSYSRWFHRSAPPTVEEDCPMVGIPGNRDYWGPFKRMDTMWTTNTHDCMLQSSNIFAGHYFILQFPSLQIYLWLEE